MNSLSFKKLLGTVRESKGWIAVLSSTIGIKAISLFRGLYIAKYLGPEVFGILNAIQLINQLNKYGALGFNTIVSREVPYSEGREEKEQATIVKNNAYSSELILAGVLLIVGLVSSLFIHDKTIKYAIVLATFGLFLAKLAKMHSTEIIVEKLFINFAKATFIVEIIVTVFILLFVPYYGMHAILFFTAFGSLLLVAYYQSRINYQFRFSIVREELKRQIKIGIPLVLDTLSYGSYRYSERFIILILLGVTDLGYYGLASRLMDSILGIALTRVKVIKIKISEILGSGDYVGVHNLIYRETLLFSLGLLLLAPIIGLMVDYFVPVYLENYVQAIAILKLIAIASAIRIMGSFAYIILISPLVNKQKYLAPAQIAATIIIIGLSWYFHHFDTLTLYRFVIIDIVGYLVYHICLLVLYYIFFVRKYLIKP